MSENDSSSIALSNVVRVLGKLYQLLDEVGVQLAEYCVSYLYSRWGSLAIFSSDTEIRSAIAWVKEHREIVSFGEDPQSDRKRCFIVKRLVSTKKPKRDGLLEESMARICELMRSAKGKKGQRQGFTLIEIDRAIECANGRIRRQEDRWYRGIRMAESAFEMGLCQDQYESYDLATFEVWLGSVPASDLSIHGASEAIAFLQDKLTLKEMTGRLGITEPMARDIIETILVELECRWRNR